MLSVTNIDLIKKIIMVLVVYFPIVTIAGCFTAWVAKKFGDHTAESQGLLSFNPMQHASLFGLGSLLLFVTTNIPFVVGFGRYVPVNEKNIDYPGRKIKYLLTLLAGACANIALILLATIVFTIFWRFLLVPTGLAKSSPNFLNAVLETLMMFKYLNIFSAIINSVYGIVLFIVSLLAPDAELQDLPLVFCLQFSLMVLVWYFIRPYISLSIVWLDYAIINMISSLMS